MHNNMCFFMSLLYSKIKFEFNISNDELLKIIWQNLKEKRTGKRGISISFNQYSYIVLIFSCEA